MNNLYTLQRYFPKSLIAVLFTGLLIIVGSPIAQAKEKIGIAIISFSPYAPWYIVKEKGFLKEADLDIQIIEDITAKNASLANGTMQCMMNTLDSVVVAKTAGIPLKVVAIPAMSFGLDQMVVSDKITSVKDFPGKTYGADYAFLNHMWMLLTLQKAGIAFDQVSHRVMLPQESAAAFSSNNLDIDVNYMPFSQQSLKRPGSHVLKSSFTDKTWERGLISESVACNENWLNKNPKLAKKLMHAWFEAVNWWKEHPQQGDEIVAKGLGWPVSDVKLTQNKAIMLSLNQNMGAYGIGNGQPVCASLPTGVPEIPKNPSGWGKALFNGAPDCAVGYLAATWNLFGHVYEKAGVLSNPTPAKEGLSSDILEQLVNDGVDKQLTSNKWIGRLGID